jgi:hypothetical protein
MEYQYKRNNMDKETYLKKFHKISSARASLGLGKVLKFKTPPNPLEGHRAFRIQSGFGTREGKSIGFLGIRPAYHDIDDISIGFMRGTQIEFLNLELSYTQKENLELENATFVSVMSIAQRSDFFKNLSWRVKLGYDKNYLYDNKSNFIITGGAGFSWGNDLGYIYLLADPLAYIGDDSKLGLGGSFGFVIDNIDSMSTHIEYTHRIYEDEEEQKLLDISQNFRLLQNIELKFVYNYKTKKLSYDLTQEETFKSLVNFYF